MTNTDDFLVRHLKGCIQLGAAPIIPNGINMVPVNHVARCVVACAFHLPPVSKITKSGIRVAQVTAKPRLTFTQFTDVLKIYGYDVNSVPYEQWKQKLVQYVEEQQQQQSEGGKGKEEHALMPLYHFVTGMFSFPVVSPSDLLSIAVDVLICNLTNIRIQGDLPSTTRAPLLDDTNTQAALAVDSPTNESTHDPSVTPDVIGLYVAYLVRVGFVPAAPAEGKPLPKVEVEEGMGLTGRGRG